MSTTPKKEVQKSPRPGGESVPFHKRILTEIGSQVHAADDLLRGLVEGYAAGTTTPTATHIQPFEGDLPTPEQLDLESLEISPKDTEEELHVKLLNEANSQAQEYKKELWNEFWEFARYKGTPDLSATCLNSLFLALSHPRMFGGKERKSVNGAMVGLRILSALNQECPPTVEEYIALQLATFVSGDELEEESFLRLGRLVFQSLSWGTLNPKPYLAALILGCSSGSKAGIMTACGEVLRGFGVACEYESVLRDIVVSVFALRSRIIAQQPFLEYLSRKEGVDSIDLVKPDNDKLEDLALFSAGFIDWPAPADVGAIIPRDVDFISAVVPKEPLSLYELCRFFNHCNKWGLLDQMRQNGIPAYLAYFQLMTRLLLKWNPDEEKECMDVLRLFGLF